MNEYFPYLLVISLAVIAFLYSSVGHGGASGYLAAMALFGVSAFSMKTAALLLNIVVSLIAFIQFYKGGYFRWRVLIVFVVTSIPAAYFGAGLALPDILYKKLLAIFLIIAALKLLFPQKEIERKNAGKLNYIAAMSIGAVIGFISGMIGIGGGILLSPVLLLLRWSDMKETAAVSAAFIFVNSMAGVAAILLTTNINDAHLSWIFAGAAGGAAGGFLGSKVFSSNFLRKILSLVMLIASVKLLTV